MHSICVDVRCDKGTSKYRVRVKGASDFVDCPPGSTLVLSNYSIVFRSGTIECAPYEEMCNTGYYRSEIPHIPVSGTTDSAHHLTLMLMAALVALVVFAG
ncbi:unnamed protein product [Phytomonas sp. Hart1]|nr:unnamed protein product [Phytomonas sp. Hart1]|eukprot:CCW69088.1 unnamed protein product [Phytomonas sp. isolate Hart1]